MVLVLQEDAGASTLELVLSLALAQLVRREGLLLIVTLVIKLLHGAVGKSWTCHALLTASAHTVDRFWVMEDLLL